MQTVGDGTACEEVVLVFTVCEEEEGTGENQDETCGSVRKMWQEKNWSLNMRGDVLDVERYDVECARS